MKYDIIVREGLQTLIGKIKGLLNLKQDTLKSGTNIKTINNESLLGSGNIDIKGVPDLTANKVVITDGSKNLSTSTVSSTELGYLSGAKSNIQSQINNKADTTHTHDALLKVDGSNGTQIGVDTLLNKLQAGTDVIKDSTNIITENVNGGGTYTRRPASKIYEWLKSKFDLLYATKSHTHSNATSSAAGFMSSSDKSKLDGLNNYTLPVATSTILGGVKSSEDVSVNSLGEMVLNKMFIKSFNLTDEFSVSGINNIMDFSEYLPVYSSVTGSWKTVSYILPKHVGGTFYKIISNIEEGLYFLSYKRSSYYAKIIFCINNLTTTNGNLLALSVKTDSNLGVTILLSSGNLYLQDSKNTLQQNVELKVYSPTVDKTSINLLTTGVGNSTRATGEDVANRINFNSSKMSGVSGFTGSDVIKTRYIGHNASDNAIKIPFSRSGTLYCDYVHEITDFDSFNPYTELANILIYSGDTCKVHMNIDGSGNGKPWSDSSVVCGEVRLDHIGIHGSKQYSLLVTSGYPINNPRIAIRYWYTSSGSSGKWGNWLVFDKNMDLSNYLNKNTTDTQVVKGYVQFANGAGNSSSDMRYKKNISDLDNVLNKILELRIFNYTWNKLGENKIDTFGLDATQIKELFPRMYHERNDEDKTQWLEYDRCGVLALKAIQELYDRLVKLENKLINN